LKPLLASVFLLRPQFLLADRSLLLLLLLIHLQSSLPLLLLLTLLPLLQPPAPRAFLRPVFPVPCRYTMVLQKVLLVVPSIIHTNFLTARLLLKSTHSLRGRRTRPCSRHT
jgi:hypothetical protein